MFYATAMSFHVLYIPFYLKSTDNNFLFLKPDFVFTTKLFIYMSTQLIILQI